MKFVNNGEPKKIRVGDINAYDWLTIRTGQIVDLPEKLGKIHNFDVVSEDVKNVKAEVSSVGDVEVETKQIADPSSKKKRFEEKLKSIKGIGKKTAEDILKHFPTEEDLIKNLNNLGLRDDIELKIKKEFS